MCAPEEKTALEERGFSVTTVGWPTFCSGVWEPDELVAVGLCGACNGTRRAPWAAATALCAHLNDKVCQELVGRKNDCQRCDGTGNEYGYCSDPSCCDEEHLEDCVDCDGFGYEWWVEEKFEEWASDLNYWGVALRAGVAAAWIALDRTEAKIEARTGTLSGETKGARTALEALDYYLTLDNPNEEDKKRLRASRTNHMHGNLEAALWQLCVHGPTKGAISIFWSLIRRIPVTETEIRAAIRERIVPWALTP